MMEKKSEYENLLEKLKEAAVEAKRSYPKCVNMLKKEDPMLNNEEKYRTRVKKDVIALGFSTDYVVTLYPNRVQGSS